MDVVTFVRASAVFPFFQKKRIAEIANNLCSKPVTSIGKAFIENVRKINALLGMPYDLVARGLGSVESVMMYALCALETVSVETKSTEENTRRTQERLKEKFSDPKHKDEFARQIDSGIAVPVTLQSLSARLIPVSNDITSSSCSVSPRKCKPRQNKPKDEDEDK